MNQPEVTIAGTCDFLPAAKRRLIMHDNATRLYWRKSESKPRAPRP